MDMVRAMSKLQERASFVPATPEDAAALDEKIEDGEKVADEKNSADKKNKSDKK